MKTGTMDYDAISNGLKQLSPKDREAAIKSLQEIIDREMVDLADTSDNGAIECPGCGCHDVCKNGHNKSGTQRYLCKHCGKTFVPQRDDIGNILALTKLDKSVWKKYCECFIHAFSVRETAKICGVSVSTSLYMRRRMLQIVEKSIPSFEVKTECNIEVDEMYIAESFKGNHKHSKFKMPRQPRRNGIVNTRGISAEQIAVMTGITDNGDMFYAVACRGNISKEIAIDVLKDKVASGAIVSTDKHHAYIGALKKLGVKCHDRFDANGHKGLGHINALHSKIRNFLRPFRGVSTRWLSQYLAWFKWLETFKGYGSSQLNDAIGQMVHGSYEYTRRMLPSVPHPFIDENGKQVKC